MPSPHCSNLKTKYQELLSLTEQFQVALEEAAKSGNYHTLEELKQTIEAKKEAIETILIPFERELHIKEQYEKQKAVFEKIGLLEKQEGILGITDIEGVFHPFPTLQEVSKRLRNKRELLTKKKEQGFGRLLIVPFGMKIETFIKTMKKTILAHYVPDPSDPTGRTPDPTKTKLWSKDADGTRVPLELDAVDPISLWDKYQDADTDGSLVYLTKDFDKDPTKHQGKTKKELLKTNGAFHILMLETNLVIPREHKGHTQGGRKQFEADNGNAKEYLERLLTDLQYNGEQGLTPEAWMTLFLLQLEMTDEVIDDYLGDGSFNYNLGGYFPASGNVSCGYWNRDDRLVIVDGLGPSDRFSYFGARPAVMI